MLACNETITIIRCNGESYTTVVINGVSWYDKIQAKLESTGMTYANEVKIRIPTASLPDKLPEVGDLVIKGVIPDIPTVPADIAPYKPRKIMAVGDNRRGRIPHVAVTAQ